MTTRSTAHSNGEWAVLVAVLAVASALVLWVTHDFQGDDPHITFTYSRNLADGMGFVFNHGDRTLSTTTPLIAIVMAAPSAAGLDVQLVGILLSVTAVALAGVLLYLNLRRVVTALAGLIGAAVVVLHPFTLRTVSNEMLVYIAFALLSFHLLARRRFTLSAISAATTVLIRPDGALVLVMVALGMTWLVWRGSEAEAEAESGRIPPAGRWLRLAWPAAAAAAVLLPWIVFATWYFGSPVPVTLRAKQAQREAGLGDGFIGMIDRRLDVYTSNVAFTAAGLIALGGLVVFAVVAIRSRRSARDGGHAEQPSEQAAWETLVLAVVWNVLYAAAYIVLDVTAYGWYASPLIISVGIGTAFGVSWIVDATRRFGPLAVGASSVVLALVCVAPLVDDVVGYRDEPPMRQALYPPTGEWLRVNVPPDATVGTLEVGLIGYHGHRTIVDFAGLLQPDAATEADLDEGFDAIAEEAWTRYRPDFVAMLRPGIPTIVDDPDFVANCTLVTTISREDVVEVMDIFDCRT